MKKIRIAKQTNTKRAIHRRVIGQMVKELGTVTASAKASFAAATDDAHRAEHKYDTFKLEESFLARGQAKRVKELTDALDSLRMLPLKDLPEGSPVQYGALVRLKASNGTTSILLFSLAAGGETIVVDGEEVTVVTSQSPLGQALLGKRAGETFDMKIGRDLQTFEIVSIS